jgi:hypothetical protein
VAQSNFWRFLLFSGFKKHPIRQIFADLDLREKKMGKMFPNCLKAS